MQRIAIHSVPRSGSTWLGSIFDSHPKVIYRYQPLFSYAFKAFLNEKSNREEILDFFDRIKGSDDDFVNQKAAKDAGMVPSFVKSESIDAVVYKEVRYHNLLRNLLKQDERIKVIGLVRNPLSTIYSWWKAPKEFRNELGWKLQEEWLEASKKNDGKVEEFNGYNKWKEVALLFEELKHSWPERFYLLNYRHLLLHTDQVVRDLFSFCGLEFCSQTDQFIHESQISVSADPYSVNKVKKGDRLWQGNLPGSMVDYIMKDIKGTVLAKYLELDEFSGV